ncbi:MAG: transposase, partial [Raoultibacter sp.]
MSATTNLRAQPSGRRRKFSNFCVRNLDTGQLSLPLYRIANDLHSQLGLHISRQTLSNWVITTHERWLAQLYDLMKERLLKHDILHVDETTVQVLKEPKRTPETKSYMWVYATAQGSAPLYLFEYNQTRARCVVRSFLEGWEGTIITDGYAAYKTL